MAAATGAIDAATADNPGPARYTGAVLRLASLLNFLALGILLAGTLACFRAYRPNGLSEGLAAALGFSAGAVFHPVVLVAAVAAVAATFAARFFERPTPLQPSRTVHQLDAVASSGGGIRARAERLSRQLEARLRGRTDLVEFVDELLAGALGCRASDVHLEPRQGTSRIALRLEGELVDVASPAESYHVQIVRRLKVMAHLVPYKTDIPQDGRFSLETGETSVDVRVSIVPTQHGEKVALRFLKPETELLDLGELGMDAALQETFRSLLAEPQGLVVLTGPTGSGKTTTLYSALQHIHRSRGESTQIATIEDPVEIDLPFLSQTPVDRTRGLDFAAGLRALLRQDPNVLMVGEIRDAETARTAVQAGLTGHLVLTSLHADGAAGVFARLIDMEIEPFLVASSTLACVSQRLVQCLCPDCLRPARVERREAARLVVLGVDPGARRFSVSDGCRSCDGSGVRGRTAIFEMLRVTPELRRRIASKVTTPEIEEEARRTGMTPLHRSALELAGQGRISLEEALRVAG